MLARALRNHEKEKNDPQGGLIPGQTDQNELSLSPRVLNIGVM